MLILNMYFDPCEFNLQLHEFNLLTTLDDLVNCSTYSPNGRHTPLPPPPQEYLMFVTDFDSDVLITSLPLPSLDGIVLRDVFWTVFVTLGRCGSVPLVVYRYVSEKSSVLELPRRII